MKNHSKLDFNTKCVHSGIDEYEYGSVVPPIYQTSTRSGDRSSSGVPCLGYTRAYRESRRGLCQLAADLGGPNYLIQHCHGAPGMSNGLAALPSGPNNEFDHLLIKGGELIWKAGPLTKGSNLCHGTAGNGYAFLKLYRRTGNHDWLDRARAFAMHAIRQCERHARRYGQLRYSLWTGDLGLAIYLWDCIQGEAHFPTMDVF